MYHRVLMSACSCTHFAPPPPLPAETTAPWFSVRQQHRQLKQCTVLQGLFKAAKAPGPAGPPCQEGYSTGNTIRDTHATGNERTQTRTHVHTSLIQTDTQPDTTHEHAAGISCLLCAGRRPFKGSFSQTAEDGQLCRITWKRSIGTVFFFFYLSACLSKTLKFKLR